VIWIGVETPAYADMVAFFRRLGSPSIVFEQPNSIEFEYPNGTRAQFTAASARTSIVPLFEVEDDIINARQELVDANVTVTEIRSDDAWDWFEAIAPDGQKVEVGSSRSTASLRLNGNPREGRDRDRWPNEAVPRLRPPTVAG
jgi:hypothetical protein